MSQPLIQPGAPSGAPQPPVERPSRLELVDRIPPRRWWKKLLLFFTFCGVAVVLVGAAAFLGLYYHFSKGLPSVPRVDEYRPPILSEFRSDDGYLAGEFYNERRKVVPYDHIPRKLVQAFVAAEDKNFFDHPGMDIEGTIRAATKMLRGHRTQGGSTLTQQTAKAILVSTAMEGLRADEIMAEADKAVPPAPAPDAAAVQAEVQAGRKARFGDNAPKAEANAPATDAELNEARARLNDRAQAARREQVLAEFTKIRARKMNEAWKRATVRKGKDGIVRKIREAILSHRLEKALTKEEILYLYLNNVYLGHHAYGVQAAAENYFRKDVRDLTLAEIGLLAGLPQSPTKNPFARPKESKDRRSYVLRRMYEEGMITEDEREKADRTPVKAYDVEDPFHDVAPFMAEQVRRDIVNRYGNEKLLNQGLQVDLTMDAERQRAAQSAMLSGLIQVDKRQGFYGPLMHFEKGQEKERDAFLAKVQAKLTKDEPAMDGYYPALVKAVNDKDEYAELQIGTKHEGKLPIAGMRWARKPNPNAYYPASLISRVKSALKEGDVILVRKRTAEDLKEDVDSKFVKMIPAEGDLYSLEQEPQLQGAIVSIDPHKNYASAMIGGYDYDASEFNRAFQACRQPGSAFKPLTYSAAIEFLDYNASTTIVDSPVVTDDDSTGLRWKPQNYEEDFKGDVIVRQALMESMNIPAIKTFWAVGVDRMRDWAKKLGLSTEVHGDLSSALGSSCVHPWELANVYAVFDRDGRKEPVYFVRQVRDRFGRVLEDHTAYDDPWASLEDRLKAGYARLADKPEQVMTPETAIMITSLLHDVATGGTGASASKLNKPVAGKTGTTNDSHDTWFVGFTKELVTAVWLGYDDYKHDPMGRYEAGSKASLPIWLDYMKHALDGVPQPSFQPAPGADVTFARIDPKTGKKAKPGSPNAVTEPFKRDSEPPDADEPGATPGTSSSDPMMMP